jgi:hypothetical protein
MSQFQNTDQSIYAAAAAGGVILSKVPGYGTDRIQITRIDSKGRPVLKDLEGSAIQQAFKSSKFHWDGKTPLAKTLQAASFNNHGSDPNAGSKPTYKNVTVTGISWTPPPPIDRSPAKAGGAAAKGKAPATKRKVGGLSLEGPTLDELMAKKAEMDRQIAKMEAKMEERKKAEDRQIAKMEERKKAKLTAEIEALQTTLQAGIDKLDPKKAKAKKASPPASPGGAGLAKKASPPASPGGAGLAKKDKASESSGSESSGSESSGSESSGSEESGSGEDSGAEDEFSEIYQNFIASKKNDIIQHYTDVTKTTPAKSWPAKQMRSALIKEHYSIEQLRKLADDAGIDSRIKKLESLRTALSSHFSTYL